MGVIEDVLNCGSGGCDVMLVDVVEVRPRGNGEGGGANDRGDGRDGGGDGKGH